MQRASYSGDTTGFLSFGCSVEGFRWCVPLIYIDRTFSFGKVKHPKGSAALRYAKNGDQVIIRLWLRSSTTV